MQQILRFRFSDNLPPTKAKRKDGYTFLHGRNKKRDPHLTTCKLKHRLKETQPVHSMVSKWAKLHISVTRCKQNFFDSGPGRHFAPSVSTNIIWGTLCQNLSLHIIVRINKSSYIFHLHRLSKVIVVIELVRHIKGVFILSKYIDICICIPNSIKKKIQNDNSCIS